MPAISKDSVKRILCRFVPYPVGARILSFAVRMPAIEWFRRRRLHPIDALLGHLGLTGNDLASPRRRHIGLTMLYTWRYCALTRAPRSVWNRYVQLRGLERVTAPLGSGKRVIVLNSHYGQGHVANVALAREGIDKVSMAARNMLNLTFGHSSTGSGETLEFIELGTDAYQLRGLVRARDVLKQGKVLVLAGDGLHGGTAVTVPFLQANRDLRTGFAYLALLMDAEVIPMFAVQEPDGRVRVEFEPPLARPQARAAQNEAIESMVGEYAKRLEARWLKDPGQVLTQQADEYLAALRDPNRGVHTGERDSSTALGQGS